jgi:hypothetical protein
LASHDTHEIKPTFDNFESKVFKYELDDKAKESLDIYFGDDADARKHVLAYPVKEEDIVKDKVEHISVT